MANIDKIFIIQSLKTSDLTKSGEELNKKISALIPTSFINVESAMDTFDYLDKIRDEVMLTKSNYVIHFDCHGNEDGIGLFDKADHLTFIKWEDLRDKFREIYLLTKHRLIISFSSCEGLNVVKLMAEFKPCPYNLITGSFRKIGFKDSVDGYTFFYSNLYNGDPLEKVMGETRLKFPLLDFAAFPIHTLVKLGWDGYFKTQLTPEKVKERKDDIISQMVSIKGFVTKEEVAFIEKGLSAESAKEDYERYLKIFYS